MSVYRTLLEISTLATIPLAVVGFGITLRQLSRTKSAADAAATAAASTQHSLSRNNLLLLLPQLQRVEDEFERAVRQQSMDLMIAWLATWRWQAGQVRGLLTVTSPEQRTIMKALQASVTAAAETKADLLAAAPGDAVEATKGVRAAIAAVTDELGVLTALQGITAGGPDGRR